MKNLNFEEKTDTPRRNLWEVISNQSDTKLGIIWFKGGFAQYYVFKTEDNVFIRSSYLKEITEFIDKRNKEIWEEISD